MPLTVFDCKGISPAQRERIEAAVEAGGTHVAQPYEGWIAADPHGGGKFDAQGGDKTTDALGRAGVFVDLGSQQGDQIFTGTAGSLTQEFDGYVRRLPAIQSGGVVNAAPPYHVGQGLQPGS